MALFTSRREKKLWSLALVILIAIYSTLIFGQPLIRLFGNQNVQAIIFVTGMALVGATILIYGLKSNPGKIELSIYIGILAVYLMLFLRLGLAERSHLIEYSVLAIFIHKALSERYHKRKQTVKTSILAFLITFLLGVSDECIQYFLPDRVFDTTDIVFNGLAAASAIGIITLLKTFRNRKRSKIEIRDENET